MILAMREQLRGAKSHVKIIEIFPPAVKTELHDVECKPFHLLVEALHMLTIPTEYQMAAKAKTLACR
jgi:short-subunit dehydrogenase involved in D-alanine esterification of teichoic acids